MLKYINKYQENYNIIWNASWNYKYGAQGKSYNKGQVEINKTYTKLKKKYGGEIAWSGKAFKKSREKNKIELWVSDNNHDTFYGSYLSACCTFRTMFNKDVSGNAYNPSLKKSDLKNLQRIADMY